MYYYYGNDYEEAISNDPVKITKTKDLRQYEQCYNVVVSIDEVFEEEDEFDSKEELEEFIEDNNIEEYFSYKDGSIWILYYTIYDTEEEK